MTAPTYTIRGVTRRDASPKPGLDQEWHEWQVVDAATGTVLHRADLLTQAARFAQGIDPRPTGGERDPVTRCIDLLLLDPDEVDEGFNDALADATMEPGPNRSRAYWHGWHQGRPWTRPEPSPGVPLVRDCRAVLGPGFFTILGARRAMRAPA